MEKSGPDRLADELEEEADALERRNAELAEEVQDVRRDWERKRSDQNVPGAPPPERRDRDV